MYDIDLYTTELRFSYPNYFFLNVLHSLVELGTCIFSGLQSEDIRNEYTFTLQYTKKNYIYYNLIIAKMDLFPNLKLKPDNASA